jgi:hypothetical protein
MQNLEKNNQPQLLQLFEVEELEARLENKWGKEPEPEPCIPCVMVKGL